MKRLCAVALVFSTALVLRSLPAQEGDNTDKVKEGLQGSSKKMYVVLDELGHEDIGVYVEEFYERCLPLFRCFGREVAYLGPTGTAPERR